MSKRKVIQVKKGELVVLAAGHKLSQFHQMRAFRASSVPVVVAAAEEGKPASFSMVAYNGGPLQVPGYKHPIVLDLNGATFRRNVIANLDHDSHKRVGQVIESENDGKQIKLSGVFSAATEARDEVINSSRDGFEWEASIEAQPHKLELVAAGEHVNVNGQSFDGPVFIARQSTVYGVGFVGQGADENTTVSIAASAAGIFGEGSNMDFETWVASLGFDAATLSDQQKAALMKSFEASGVAASADTGGAATKLEEEEVKLVASRFDIDGLKAVYASHEAAIETVLFEAAGKVPSEKLIAIKAQALTAAVQAKQKAIVSKLPTVNAQLEFERALNTVKLDLIRAERPQGPAIHSSGRDLSQPVIEAAFARSLGSKDIEKRFDDKTLQAAHTQFRSGIGLQRMLILAASQNGMHFSPGERINNGNLRDVLQYCFMPVKAAGFSTISVSGLLSNVANKEILDGYMEEDQTWREISVTKPVSDFKQTKSYRMLDNMLFEEVGPTGEIKHGTLNEEYYTRQAKTYAKMAGLTRQDIINDDLGAFDDMKNRIGRGGIQKFNLVFWTTFMANSSHFTTARGNYIEGATTNLLTDGVGLQAGLTKFRQMKSPSTTDAGKKVGTTVGGRPEILLVPPELEHSADKLYTGSVLNVGSGPGEENTHRNKYKPVVSPWLSDTSITNYSLTAWYLLRKAASMPAIVASFLDGQEQPTVESADADFSTLGIDFRGYFDFGCDLAEYLCGIKSKGAA